MKSVWGLAAALVWAGTSTAMAEPTGIDARIGALLGQERAALDTVRRGHVARILTPRTDSADAADSATRGRADAAALAAMPEPSGGDEFACLARALYFEARGEGVDGQFAVAEVILNRVESPRYPNSICGVVYQGASRHNACQFSFACDGNPETIHESGAFALAKRIARQMKDGASRDLTDGATHFHNTSVNPHWSRSYDRTARIGEHIFYRPPIQVSAN